MEVLPFSVLFPFLFLSALPHNTGGFYLEEGYVPCPAERVVLHIHQVLRERIQRSLRNVCVKWHLIQGCFKDQLLMFKLSLVVLLLAAEIFFFLFFTLCMIWVFSHSVNQTTESVSLIIPIGKDFKFGWYYLQKSRLMLNLFICIIKGCVSQQYAGDEKLFE